MHTNEVLNVNGRSFFTKAKELVWFAFAFILAVTGMGVVQILFLQAAKCLNNVSFFSNFDIFFAFCASILEYACAIIILRVCLAERGCGFCRRTSIYPSRVKPRQAVCLFCMGFGLAASLPYVIMFVFSCIPGGAEIIKNYAEQTNATFGGSAAVAAIAVAVLIAPIAEEIMFRGYLLNYLKKSFSPFFSVFAVSALFAALHVDPFQIAYAFAMGLILTYFAYKFENAAYSVLIHFGFNFTVITTFIINNSKTIREFMTSIAGTAIYFISGVLIAAVAAVRFFSLKGDKAYEEGI